MFRQTVVLSFSVLFTLFYINTCDESLHKEITDDTLKKFMYKLSEIIGGTQDIPEQNIFINNSLVLLKASVENVVGNLLSFNVASTHVNMSHLEFQTDVGYKAASLRGEYKLYLDNEWAHLESADHFSINATDITANIYLKLNLTESQTLQIEDMKVYYNLTAQVDIENLGGSLEVSNTLNSLINKVLPDVITSTEAQVQDFITKEALPLGNNFILKGMTVDALVDFIDGFIHN